MTTLPRAVLFDIGDALVHAAAPGTPVGDLRAVPIGAAVHELRALARRFRLGAVTDTTVMDSHAVRRALEPTGLDKLLEVIVTSVDVGAPKPDPRGLRAALDQLGVTPADALFVGDADCDEQAASAVGVAFARAGNGRGSPGAAVRDHLAGCAGAFAAALALVGTLDEQAIATARAHHDRLTKPPGSLGRLETLGVQLAGIAGADPPPRPTPAAVAVFAADHGVVVEGTSAWPQAVTAQMVANFTAGGAAINVLARQQHATVTVVDVGVAGDLRDLKGDGRLLHRKVRPGTANLATGAAMRADEVDRALAIGAEVADQLVAEGANALVTGDMGIGNTTAAAAVIAALTGRPASEVTGPGAGVDVAGVARKIAVIERALGRLDGRRDPMAVLSEAGGLEIAALTGFIIGGASHRVPVVVDGVIADAALLAAVGLCPETLVFTIAGHRSTEPGATAALAHLELEPVLDLGLRLGEGTGAVLALAVVDAAALVLREMATFDQAGIAHQQPPQATEPT